MLPRQTDAEDPRISCPSSSIQTILSVLELHQILPLPARGLYRRSGISPCPEDRCSIVCFQATPSRSSCQGGWGREPKSLAVPINLLGKSGRIFRKTTRIVPGNAARKPEKKRHLPQESAAGGEKADQLSPAGDSKRRKRPAGCACGSKRQKERAKRLPHPARRSVRLF